MDPEEGMCKQSCGFCELAENRRAFRNYNLFSVMDILKN